jgi:hypothetical protein
VDNELPREIGRLLNLGRFAVQSAATGTRTADCNFGIDFSERGAGTQLPHVEGSLASIWDNSHDLLKDMLPSKEAQLLPADVGVRSEGNWAIIGIGRKS